VGLVWLSFTDCLESWLCFLIRVLAAALLLAGQATLGGRESGCCWCVLVLSK
jgi:hypothetical protein